MVLVLALISFLGEFRFFYPCDPTSKCMKKCHSVIPNSVQIADPRDPQRSSGTVSKASSFKPRFHDICENSDFSQQKDCRDRTNGTDRNSGLVSGLRFPSNRFSAVARESFRL